MAFFARPQSSAVRIARPDQQEGSTTVSSPLNSSPNPSSTGHPNTSNLASPSRKDSTQRQCRNVVIYGSCKYEGQGCKFAHPSSSPTASPDLRSESPSVSFAGLSLGTGMGMGMGTALSAHAVKAPVFVPKFGLSAKSPSASASVSPPPPEGQGYGQTSTLADSPVITTSPKRKKKSPIPKDEEQPPPPSTTEEYDYENYEGGYDYDSKELANNPYLDYPDYSDYPEEMYADYHHLNQPTFALAPIFTRQPLNYLLYTPSLPPDQARLGVGHFYVGSEQVRRVLQERGEETRGGGWVPGVSGGGETISLPEEVGGYHSLVPLENPSGEQKRKFSNWASVVYRAVKMSDGRPYVLRRIENFQQVTPPSFDAVRFWSTVRHPAIINMPEAFTTKSFGDNSLVMVYEYFPGAKTLFDVHLAKGASGSGSGDGGHGGHQVKMGLYSRGGSSSSFGSSHLGGGAGVGGTTGGAGGEEGYGPGVPERTLWSYICQIASAIKVVHDAGYAVRMIDPTKVLLTGKNRVRISSCGGIDILFHGIPQEPSYLDHLQQEDFCAFGRLIFMLGCGTVHACQGGTPGSTGTSSGGGGLVNMQTSIEVLSERYSKELNFFANLLVSKVRTNVDNLLGLVSSRMIVEHDEALMAADAYENELMGELENARLVRLLVKFGFVNERPEFARDPRWSETGDRYIIKLFRDYVFHQVDEAGRPVVDLGHVLGCLNKLDAGTEEQICLVARDEQSCLVVSYAEVRRVLEGAFGELAVASKAGNPTDGASRHGHGGYARR